MAVDGRPGHPEGVGDLLHGVLPRVVHRPGLSRVGRAHLEPRPAHAAPGAGSGEPVDGAFDDQVVLELGDRSQHVEEQPAAGGGGVDPLGQGAQPHLPGLQLISERLEVAHRPAEPIQLGDHQGVPGPQVAQRLLQRRALGQRPRRVVDEDLLAPRRRKGVGLRLGMLVAGGDPGISDQRHPTTVAQTCLALPRTRTRFARHFPADFPARSEVSRERPITDTVPDAARP